MRISEVTEHKFKVGNQVASIRCAQFEGGVYHSLLCFYTRGKESLKLSLVTKEFVESSEQGSIKAAEEWLLLNAESSILYW